MQQPNDIAEVEIGIRAKTQVDAIQQAINETGLDVGLTYGVTKVSCSTDPSNPSYHSVLISLERIKAENLRNAIEALWPFIRHFPLSGACPEASAAVMAIGEELGKLVPRDKLDAEYRYQDGVATGVAKAVAALHGMGLSKQVGPTLAGKILETVAVCGDED